MTYLEAKGLCHPEFGSSFSSAHAKLWPGTANFINFSASVRLDTVCYGLVRTVGASTSMLALCRATDNDLRFGDQDPIERDNLESGFFFEEGTSMRNESIRIGSRRRGRRTLTCGPGRRAFITRRARRARAGLSASSEAHMIPTLTSRADQRIADVAASANCHAFVRSNGLSDSPPRCPRENWTRTTISRIMPSAHTLSC